jgi:hypothetical protein
MSLDPHYREWYELGTTADPSWNAFAREVLDKCCCEICVRRRNAQGIAQPTQDLVYVSALGRLMSRDE